MIIAVFRVMILSLLRDRSALIMAFLLPPVIYLIFAAIFSVTAGGDLQLKISVLDQVRSETSQRLVQALRKSDNIRVSDKSPKNVKNLESMVRRAEIDAGVIIMTDPGNSSKNSHAPILIIGDSARAIAGPIISGHVIRLFEQYLPDIAYRRTIADLEKKFVKLSPAQSAQVNLILGGMKQEIISHQPHEPRERLEGSNLLVEQKNLPNTSKAAATVVYYAGAVGFMFLLFSAVQGAMSLIDERQNGITARMLSGSGGVTKLVFGKFLFLVLLGFIQLALIFSLADVVYGLDFITRLSAWLLITISAASCAAASALVMAVLCDTRQQATHLSNFLILVMSALGGSMIPRFLMPEWLQNLSGLLPSAWVIEAYDALLWQGVATVDLFQSIILMLGLSIIGLYIAVSSLNETIHG